MKLSELFTSEFKQEIETFFHDQANNFFQKELDDSFAKLAFHIVYQKIDHYFECDLLWNEPLSWYQEKFIQILDDNCLNYLAELMNWVTKGKPFYLADINEVNNFCSAITKTTTTPFDQEEGKDPIWNTQTNTSRNYLLLDLPQLKWVRFDALKKIVQEISYLLKTLL